MLQEFMKVIIILFMVLQYIFSKVSKAILLLVLLIVFSTKHYMSSFILIICKPGRRMFSNSHIVNINLFTLNQGVSTIYLVKRRKLVLSIDSNNPKCIPTLAMLEILEEGEERWEDYVREFAVDDGNKSENDDGSDASQPVFKKRKKNNSKSNQSNQGNQSNQKETSSSSSSSSTTSNSTKSSVSTQSSTTSSFNSSSNSSSPSTPTYSTTVKNNGGVDVEYKLELWNNGFNGRPVRTGASNRFYDLGTTLQEKNQQTTTNAWLMEYFRIGNSPGFLFTVEMLKTELLAVKQEYGDQMQYNFILGCVTEPLPKTKTLLCQMLSKIRKDGVPCSTNLKSQEIFVTSVKKYGSLGRYHRNEKIFKPFDNRMIRDTNTTNTGTYDFNRSQQEHGGTKTTGENVPLADAQARVTRLMNSYNEGSNSDSDSSDSDNESISL